MATEIAKAYVQIIPSAKGISGSLSKELGGEVSGAGSSAGEIFGKNFAGTVVKAIAALGIGKMIKDSIMAGADLEQSIGGIETLFGAGGAKSVREYADATGKAVSEVKEEYAQLMEAQNIALQNAGDAWQTAGMSANDYMQTITGFAASLKQSTENETQAANAANQAVIDMADNANKMGTSMDMIQNAYQGFAKQNYTMLDNLKLGYGGTKTEMERLLKDATALSGIEYNIDSLADVYEAIHVIQDDLGITGTTAKEAADTFTGSLNAMKAAAGNLMANLSLGKDISADLQNLSGAFFTWASNLVPMVGNILKGLPTLIDEMLKNMASGLQKLTLGGPGGFAQMGVQIITDIATSIAEWTPFLIGQFGSLLASLAQALATVDWLGMAGQIVTTLGTSINEFAQGWFGADAAGIPTAIMDGITQNLPGLLTKGTEMITNIVNGILNNLPQVIAAAGQIINNFVSFLLSNLPSVLNAGGELLRNLIEGILGKLPDLIASVLRLMAELLATIIRHFPEILRAGVELVAKIAMGILNGIPKAVTEMLRLIAELRTKFMNTDWRQLGYDLMTKLCSAIVSGISNAVGSIGQVVAAIWNKVTTTDWIGLGANIIRGLVKGIVDNAGAVVDAITGMVSGAWEAVKNFFGIESPSKLMMYAGKMVDLGFAKGITKNAGRISEAIQAVVDDAYAGFSKMPIAEAVAGAYDGMIELTSENSGVAGFTQNITVNSPQALSPSEVARQTRIATQRMVLAMSM